MCYNPQAQFMQVESNHEVGSAQFQMENVLADAQAEDSMEEETQHPKIIDSVAKLEDKVVPENSEVQSRERSEFSELENIYDPKKRLEISEEDLDMVLNVLNSLGEDLMESDILLNIYSMMALFVQ